MLIAHGYDSRLLWTTVLGGLIPLCPQVDQKMTLVIQDASEHLFCFNFQALIRAACVSGYFLTSLLAIFYI